MGYLQLLGGAIIKLQLPEKMGQPNAQINMGWFRSCSESGMDLMFFMGASNVGGTKKPTDTIGRVGAMRRRDSIGKLLSIN